MRRLFAIAIAFGGCVSPPARPEACRANTTTRDPWPCARRELRQPECLRLQNALFGTDMIDHDPGGRCGEPTRSFR